MTKDAYYFPHDSNARNDDKILELRVEFGWEGYGLFWAVIETLRDGSNYAYPSNGIGGLALNLNYPKEKLNLFLSKCFELNLLVEKNGFFHSESLMERMGRIDEKRQKRAEAGRLGGLAKAKAEQSPNIALANTSNSNAKAQQYSSNAKAKSSKQSKEKENSIFPSSDEVTRRKDFDLFWNTYQKKIGKKKCQAIWKNLPEAIKVKILEVLPSYVSNTPNLEYRKIPQNWLSGEHWNDELISIKDFPLKMIL